MNSLLIFFQQRISKLYLSEIPYTAPERIKNKGIWNPYTHPTRYLWAVMSQPLYAEARFSGSW